MLTFALSLDDFIITYFVSGSTVTYPLFVNAAVKAAVPPQINVIATAILLIRGGERVGLTGIALPPRRGEAQLTRLENLWGEGLNRFGGPYLAGEQFTAVDAFYCPVAFRVQTYGLTLASHASEYVDRLLALPAMQRWYADALAETDRDDDHENDITRNGVVTQDFRTQPPTI